MRQLVLVLLSISAAACDPDSRSQSVDAPTENATVSERTTAPIDLVVALDVSDSMTRRQLDSARAFLGRLIQLLGKKDRFGLVTIADEARVAIELAPARDESKEIWIAHLEALETGGLTNLSHALELLHDVSPPEARLVLVSDGSPTWGDVVPDEIQRLVDREPWTIGVGRNNEPLLRSLGRYHFLRDPIELADSVAAELFVESPATATGLVPESPLP